MIPPSLAIAADQVTLSAPHLAALLPAGHPPAEAAVADAIRALGAESAQLQVWIAWRAAVRFGAEWRAFVDAQHPAQGERARTMDGGVTVPAETVA